MKTIYKIILIVLTITIVIIDLFYIKKDTPSIPITSITVVPTMDDPITDDTAWCGTFALIWNDLKNEIVKKDIILDPQPSIVDNLNKEDFNESMLSNDYYYKTYGLASLDLKEEIEKNIKKKFNQTSDILDSFYWPNKSIEGNYIFYSMLYREFTFLHKFTNLPDSNFSTYPNIKYFGINNSSNRVLRDQIQVLFYQDSEHYAILINTKENDEVILYKGFTGQTFNTIYQELINHSNEYTANKNMTSQDEFKAPKLNINILKEYEELENRLITTNNSHLPEIAINKAIQTIQFSLDEKGGRVKSEAAMAFKNAIAEEPRLFYFDDKFVLFLREKGKEKPYFALTISDITKYQK